jgi:hypothetical protein
MCCTSNFTRTEPKNKEDLNSENSIAIKNKSAINPQKRLLLGLAADLFSRDGKPDDSNHSVVVNKSMKAFYSRTIEAWNLSSVFVFLLPA